MTSAMIFQWFLHIFDIFRKIWNFTGKYGIIFDKSAIQWYIFMLLQSTGFKRHIKAIQSTTNPLKNHL